MAKENWNNTARDYASYRAGFPDWFYERLSKNYGMSFQGKHILDLGTGTGLLARGFALRGAKVTGIDIAPAMIAAAREADQQAGVEIEYRIRPAEETGLADNTYDIISAGTCWHWFKKEQALGEIRRLLKRDGWMLICMLSWLPLPGNVVEQTESLVQRYNPRWQYGNMDGMKPEYLQDLGRAGFTQLESFSSDYDISYTPDAWRGRMRASAGIAATLTPSEVAAFDQELAILLTDRYPGDSISVPHRIFAAIGRK